MVEETAAGPYLPPLACTYRGKRAEGESKNKTSKCMKQAPIPEMKWRARSDERLLLGRLRNPSPFPGYMLKETDSCLELTGACTAIPQNNPDFRVVKWSNVKAERCLPDPSASMELAQPPGHPPVTLAPGLLMSEDIVSLKPFLLQNVPDKLETIREVPGLSSEKVAMEISMHHVLDSQRGSFLILSLPLVDERRPAMSATTSG